MMALPRENEDALKSLSEGRCDESDETWFFGKRFAAVS